MSTETAPSAWPSAPEAPPFGGTSGAPVAAGTGVFGGVDAAWDTDGGTATEGEAEGETDLPEGFGGEVVAERVLAAAADILAAADDLPPGFGEHPNALARVLDERAEIVAPAPVPADFGGAVLAPSIDGLEVLEEAAPEAAFGMDPGAWGVPALLNDALIATDRASAPPAWSPPERLRPFQPGAARAALDRMARQHLGAPLEAIAACSTVSAPRTEILGLMALIAAQASSLQCTATDPAAAAELRLTAAVCAHWRGIPVLLLESRDGATVEQHVVVPADRPSA